MCQRTGYDLSVAERPKTGGSSVRPRWKQGVPRCGNQTTSIGQTLTAKVTPSPAKSVGLSEATTTPGVRTRQRRGVPGAWHSQQSHPLQPVTPTRILTVPGVGGTANLKLPTQRFGAVGFLRVHAEEDVKFVAAIRGQTDRLSMQNNDESDCADSVTRPSADNAVYETIFDTITNAVFLIAVEAADDAYTFRFQRTNHAHQERTGIAQAEIRGQTPADLFEDDQASAIRANYRECVDRRESITYEERIEAPAGVSEWSTTLTPVTEDGEVTKIVGVSREITEQKRRQKRLEQTQHRVELALEATNSAVYEIDRATAVVDTYPTPNPVFGTAVQSVEEFYSQVHPDDRQRVRRETQLDAPGEAYDLEYRIQTDDGVRWVSDYGKRIDTEAAEDAIDVGIITDNTTQKDRQRKLQRQNERLNEFASVIAHDLRNPLNVAQGRAGLLVEDTDSPHIEPLVGALDRMETIVEETLTLARQGETIAEQEPITLAELVGKCWTQVDGAEATLTVGGDMTVCGDFDRLQHVFENLFRNAVEHGGDSVAIAVGRLENGNGFYVEDDGPGIPATERDSIFDPGYTSAEGGTGFGLTIVRRIVEAHGWEIRVTTGTDGGARFEVTGVTFVAD